MLLRYNDDGHFEIDNNAAERSLRAVALSRKNEQAQKETQAKLDQSLLSQEHMKGQLNSFAIVLGTIKSTNPLYSNSQLADLPKKMIKPVPINSVLDVMNPKQLQDSVLALVKQMRETDTEFERQEREMGDRHFSSQRAVPAGPEHMKQLSALNDKNLTEMQQLKASENIEFRRKYLGRAISVRDQMLKRIPPDKVPQEIYTHFSLALDLGQLTGADRISGIAYYLERLALALPID